MGIFIHSTNTTKKPGANPSDPVELTEVGALDPDVFIEMTIISMFSSH